MPLLSPNNLLKPSDGGPVAVPSQDMVLGVYYLTMKKLADHTGKEGAVAVSDHVYNDVEEIKALTTPNPETGKAKQLYLVIGYYEKRDEALMALSEYNCNPYDIEKSKITFRELYEKWSKEHFPKVSPQAITNYSVAYKYCSSLYDMPFKNIILLGSFQKVRDDMI